MLLGKLKVLIADDHPLMLAGIRGALENQADIEIVGEATSGAQVLPLVAHAAPDVVLLDVHLPELDGLACLSRIRERHPDVRVVMISVCSDHDQITQALEGGASAYIVKSIDTTDLAAAIRQTVSGAFVCFGDLNRAQAERKGKANGAGLSEREVEILQGVARGLSNRAIAKDLWLSDQTVKFHLHNIYRKLGVSNRTEAAAFAFEHGLAEAPGAAAVSLA
jgi:DNA-binding NarL/FixJ family response regulator